MNDPVIQGSNQGVSTQTTSTLKDLVFSIESTYKKCLGEE